MAYRFDFGDGFLSCRFGSSSPKIGVEQTEWLWRCYYNLRRLENLVLQSSPTEWVGGICAAVRFSAGAICLVPLVVVFLPLSLVLMPCIGIVILVVGIVILVVCSLYDNVRLVEDGEPGSATLRGLPVILLRTKTYTCSAN